MKNRKLKKNVVYALYAFAFVTVLGTIYLLEIATSPTKFKEDSTYVNDTIIDDYVPVTNTKKNIVRPYTASNVSLARNYYNHQDTKENQVNSIIYYDGIYMPNSGVDYKSEEVFEIVSVLDGVITNITENSVVGKIVEVTHENNLITLYQSLSDVSVILNEQILQGQVIGKSGTANISVDLGNHLHFEMIHNGITVNPEAYYDKKINEL